MGLESLGLSCHDHGNCELCDSIEAELTRLRAVAEAADRYMRLEWNEDDVPPVDLQVAAKAVWDTLRAWKEGR